MANSPETVQLQEVLGRRTGPAAPELVRALPDERVQCLACGHRCKIGPGRRGTCQVRFNAGGTLRVPWGYVAGIALDPMEKKPFFHVLPGENAFSFGMLGCDLHCAYCQNWITSQALRDDKAITPPQDCTPQELVEMARGKSRVMVSTYNEPLITSEWGVAVLQEARQRGMYGAYVSNGNATPEVLDFLTPWVDFYKVDLKSFDDRRYRELGAVLANTLDTIQGLKQRGVWVEVVTLVIPGFNDSDAELTGIARFLAGVARDIPWHVTAFHPDYKMDTTPPTPATTLLRAWEIGRAEGLSFVYAGNLPGQVGNAESTRCPHCETTLIRRHGYRILENTLKQGRCSACDLPIPGFFCPPQATGSVAPR